MARKLERLGHHALRGVAYLGGAMVFFAAVARRTLSPPLGTQRIAVQMESAGMRSLVLTLVMALFAGMVLAFQFGEGMMRFGAKEYISEITTLALVKEIVPILVALVVGGRIAAGMAAEIGSMTATEQVDALRALGADPIKWLAVPRVLATALVLPLVTIAGDVVGTLGGMIVGRFQFRVPMSFFLTSMLDMVTVTDFLSGVAKSLVFGVIVAVIACFEGFSSRGGTVGVGQATTRAFIYGAISVIVTDYFLTKLLWML